MDKPNNGGLRKILNKVYDLGAERPTDIKTIDEAIQSILSLIPEEKKEPSPPYNAWVTNTEIGKKVGFNSCREEIINRMRGEKVE